MLEGFAFALPDKVTSPSVMLEGDVRQSIAYAQPVSLAC